MAPRRRQIPPAPGDLSEESIALWPGLVSDLDKSGSGAEVDLIVLADVLRARDRLAEIAAKLDEEGLTVEGSKGQRRSHPLLSSEQVLRQEVAEGFDRLGLSFSRRGDVVITNKRRLREE